MPRKGIKTKKQLQQENEEDKQLLSIVFLALVAALAKKAT